MPTSNEVLIRELAKEIDSDEPPGMAARNLARAAVCLVRDRSGPQAVLLEAELNKLAFLIPRSPTDEQWQRETNPDEL
jgi:hypothetical protein